MLIKVVADHVTRRPKCVGGVAGLSAQDVNCGIAENVQVYRKRLQHSRFNLYCLYYNIDEDEPWNCLFCVQNCSMLIYLTAVTDILYANVLFFILMAVNTCSIKQL